MLNSELAKFTASIDAAWMDLHSSLAGVTPSHALKRDPAGWSVKDRATHLAVWEEPVAILFRGGRRHEALGIEELSYTAGSFDEINEVIKVRLEGTALQEAIRNLEGAHRQLMDHLTTLRDADLNSGMGSGMGCSSGHYSSSARSSSSNAPGASTLRRSTCGRS